MPTEQTEAAKRGATLSFVDGLLEVKISGYGRRNGDGRISFKEEDLDWGSGEDSGWLSTELKRSELESIRDFLTKHLPGPPANAVTTAVAPTVEELTAMIVEARREPGIWRADVQAKFLAEKIRAAIAKAEGR